MLKAGSWEVLSVEWETLSSCLAGSSSAHSFVVAARVMEGEEMQLYIHAHAAAEQRPC